VARNSKKASDSLQPRRQSQYEQLTAQPPKPPQIGELLRGIPDGLMVFDDSRRCVYSNEAFAAFLRTTPGELIGKTIDEAFPESHYSRLRAESILASEKKTPVKFEDYRDGTGRWHEYHCHPLANGAMAIVLYDTTDRKRVESSLLESRRVLEAAIAGSSAGVWRIDLDPQRPRFDPDYAYISPQLKALIGFRDEELPNSRSAWRRRILPEDRPRVREAYQAHAEGRTAIYQVDYRIHHKDGSVRWLSSRGKLYHDEYNRPTRWAGIDWDITDRKRLEEELANAKQDWERTFDAVPDLIAIIDLDHRIVRANRAMAQRLGQARPACVGSNCHDCVHGTGTPPELCPHALTLRDGREHTAEIYEERLGGHFLVSCTPLFDEQKRVIGSVHVARDITEQRHADEEIKKASLLALQNPSPVLRVSRDGRILFANDASKSLLQSCRTAVGAQAPQEIQKAVEQALAGGGVIETEVTCVPAVYSFSIAPIPGEAYANLYGRDITERKQAEDILRQSEERFRRAVENAGAGVIIAELDGTIRYANQAFLRLVGYREQDTAAGTLRWDVLTPPEYAPADTQAINELIATSVTRVYEKEYVAKDGHRVPILVSGSVMGYGSEGQPQVVAFITDLSAIRRAEVALHESEERFRATCEQAAVGIEMLDLDGRYLQGNHKLSEMLGYSEDDLHTLTFAQITNPEDLRREQPLLNQLLAGEIPSYSIEKRYLHKDGHEVWVRVTSSMARVSNPYRISIIEDITARKQVEDALRRSESILAQAGKLANLGAWDIEFREPNDVDRHPLHWSDETYRIFGFEPQSVEVTNDLFFRHVLPEDRQRVRDAFAKALAEKTPYEIEHRIVRPDGTERTVIEHAELRLDDQGRPSQMVGAVQDITERKRQEEELRRLNRTLRALSNSNQAMVHAETEQDLLDRVCRIIVHDCGFQMVWIGYAEEDEARSVRPVAHAGFEQGYLDTLKISWADTERGRGPTGTAIRTGRASVCEDMLTDPRFGPWRQEAIERGFASSLSLPLMTDGRPFGALVIYAKRPNAFSGDDVRLLSELAEDLGHGITTIRLRVARRQAEQALQDANTQLQWQAEELRSQTNDLISANRQLHDSEQRLRLTLEGGRMGRWEWNPQTDTSAWGDRVYELLGLDKSVPPSSQVFFSCVDRRDREMVRRAIRQATARDGDFQVEFRINRLRGSGPNGLSPHKPVWATLRGQVVHHETEQASQIFGVMYDVTQRKQMEVELHRLNEKLEKEVHAQTEELRQSVDRLQEEVSRRVLAEGQLYMRSQMLEAFFQHTLTPLAFMDRAFNFVRVNAAYAGASGLEPDFFVGKNYFDLYPDPETREIFHQVVRTRQPYSAHARPRSQDGQPAGTGTTYWNWLITPLLNDSGDVEYLVFNLEDVTRQQTAIHELQHRTQQLQRLTLELSEAEDRERKRIAEILHDDLQQILAAAKFQLGLLGKRTRNDPAQYKIVEQVDHLLKDAIGRSRSLSHELSPAVLRHGSLGDTLDWLAGQMQAKHGLIVHVAPDGEVHLKSDALTVFLYKAAQELLFNVVKHARVNEASIRVRRHGRVIGLSVSDKGRGFDPQKVREAPGFGLFSIRERAETLCGRMKIKSAPGQGSTFYVAVPDETETEPAKGGTGEKTMPAESPTPPFAQPSSGETIRVLVVDDHEVVREGLASLLDEERGIEVVGEAGNGREAVNLAVRLRPDVVIMDFSMPVMNGDEATRQIKLELPQTRVVALSMFDEMDMIDRMRRAGAATYVLKTAPSGELLAAIRGTAADPVPQPQ
jgi:PAS domain S-box-containing protein